MQSWIPFVPESASTESGKVDALYFYLSGVTVFFTLLIALAIIFFVIKYRRRTPHEVPRPIAGSHRLEMLWSVIPFVIAMSFFVWGAQLFFRNSRPPTDALEVYVVGKQWMWKFQHTTGQREINELHVPVGRKIKLIMATEDVIHDVYIPAFRIKADVVPGKYTSEWFEATKPGRYHLFCAEYCGMNHSGMGGWVVVMEPTEFDNWLSGNVGAQSTATTGHQLFQTLGCASCHGPNGEGGRGPALLGVFNSQVQLATGQTIHGDESYIRESILNPQAKIVAGYGPIMPTFQGVVNEEQMVQLIAYLKSMSSNPASAPGAAGTTAAPGPQGSAKPPVREMPK
jgi:cytochrome c oxidase subunit 2